jgi:DNA-binding response OmpR family regulator
MTPKVLIVEDEPDMARGLQFNLEARGFEVVLAADGEAGLRAAAEAHPDLVVLDVMLPKRDGFDVCRTLRRTQPTLPILMLTARGHDDDAVLGLKLGADDYVRKPFSVAELLARIETLLRRASASGSRPPRLAFAGVDVDFLRHEAFRDGQPLELSAKEFEMLRYFAARRGEVVSREDLLNEVWGYNSMPGTRTVDTHMVKLRQKIEADPAQPRHLITVHGLGYKFVG